MLLNYLKIAFRNLFRNKTYSAINIVGLGMGMGVSILILLFVMHEYSFDKFHEKHERIYKVSSNVKMGENRMNISGFSADFGPSVKRDIAHVQDFVRIMPSFGKAVIKNPARPNEMFYEENFLYADASIFKVFSFPLKQGTSDQVFDKVTAAVISEKIAAKYFGSADPLGKTLLHESGHTLEITGVVKNAPSNSSIVFDFIVPLAAFPILNGLDRTRWEAGGSFTTYLLLDSESSVEAVQTALLQTNNASKLGEETTYLLENLASIRLGEKSSTSANARLINIFAGIAVLILSLALFNYMSLTTARAMIRSKEVGVRKIIGSGKIELIKQFYVESALLCFFAFLISFFLFEILRSSFLSLLGLEVDVNFLKSPLFLSLLATLLVLTPLIAGSYPALVLSGFSPLNALKGKVLWGQSGGTVRKAFMVFQFVVSVSLVVCSLVVRQQIFYMEHKKLGLHKDQVLAIPVDQGAKGNVFAFRDELKARTNVQSASIADYGLFKGYSIWFVKHPKTQKGLGIVNLVTDQYFVETLALNWRIEPDSGTFQNRNHTFLNESAIKALGIEKNPLGNPVSEMSEVAGVLQDFQFSGPQDGIRPMMLTIVNDTTNFKSSFGHDGIIYARLDPKADIKANVEAIAKIFKKYEAEKPFEYYFLDEAFNETFKTEMRMSKMFSAFTAVAIFIACMGLFGLVTFTAETRTKEIGIRKVLGASVAGIVALLSRDFLKLILLSIILSLPIAWYFMEKWLQDFAYRIQIPIWIYAAASAGAMIIALITISFQSIKAALINPVESLKGE
ncbi:ABC transporter permease [Dyadobacter aurulentus]|uniref:ABC transporter permease n=1 Tax=Dyadobacter sp. UC 10 TaxID=2605428 RepID=UPI0011F2A817|nr:ABC transporter permease [Dyadobacter sp. UC 10]KAA0989594.1 FtsX-like permease family protein [Dyadobacter sp. UC 10]